MLCGQREHSDQDANLLVVHFSGASTPCIESVELPQIDILQTQRYGL